MAGIEKKAVRVRVIKILVIFDSPFKHRVGSSLLMPRLASELTYKGPEPEWGA